MALNSYVLLFSMISRYSSMHYSLFWLCRDNELHALPHLLGPLERCLNVTMVIGYHARPSWDRDRARELGPMSGRVTWSSLSWERKRGRQRYIKLYSDAHRPWKSNSLFQGTTFWFSNFSLFANARAVKIQAPKCYCHLCVNEPERVCRCVLCVHVSVYGGLVTKLCPTLEMPWAVAHQAPLSMGFSSQEYWSGLPFPPPGDLPNPGMWTRVSCVVVRFFTDRATREAPVWYYSALKQAKLNIRFRVFCS